LGGPPATWRRGLRSTRSARAGHWPAPRRRSLPVYPGVFHRHVGAAYSCAVSGSPRAPKSCVLVVTYHLRRLRLHFFIARIDRTHVTFLGLRTALFFTRTYVRVLRPGLAPRLKRSGQPEAATPRREAEPQLT